MIPHNPYLALKGGLRVACFLARDAGNALRYGRTRAPRSAQRINIYPAEIKLVLKRSIPRWWPGRVLGGDWDLNVVPLAAHPKIKFCHNHFENGLSWEECGAIDYMATKLLQKKNSDGCRCLEEIRQRYEYLDRLYNHLRNGDKYLTQKELYGNKVFRESGGIYIHIGREGEIIFGGGGCHRLAIARVCKLEHIPAQLGVVHQQALARGDFEKILHRDRQLEAACLQSPPGADHCEKK